MPKARLLPLPAAAALLLLLVAPASPARGDGFEEARRRFDERYKAGDYREKVEALKALLAADEAKGARVLVDEVLWREPDQYVYERGYEALQAVTSDAAKAYVASQARDHAIWQVRAMCARLLRSLDSPEASQALVAALSDKVWQVRAQVVDTMRERREKAFIEPLIERLKLEDGRLRADCVDALEAITGAALGDKVDSWRTWWESVKADFQVPRAASAKERGRKADVGTVVREGRIFEALRTHRVIFVIDISGSMDAGAGGGQGTRLEMTKKELARVVDKELAKGSRFNLIVYADQVFRWRPRMVPADASSRGEAKAFAQRLKANGNTITYDALEAAFEDPQADTIYLLSDGVPTLGKQTSPELIKSEVRRLNRFRGVRIHTVAFLSGDSPQQDKEEAKAFMKELAEENGGTYKLIE